MGAGREMLISLDNVRDNNMMQLKKINTALFPIRYNDKYYSDALASGDFTMLMYVCERGEVGWGLEVPYSIQEDKNDRQKYDRFHRGSTGIGQGDTVGGTKLLNHVLDLSTK
ncbi:hypothetical protein RDI58_020357 [Solanum bulbocastanum]|uniref:Uncharacterized protein n=1 Tax=Solanum bulbocastanum TaxID=147425 RepID=A0AAN8Y8I0_SOLBU